jgi:cytochrome c peroxidase
MHHNRQAGEAKFARRARTSPARVCTPLSARHDRSPPHEPTTGLIRRAHPRNGIDHALASPTPSAHGGTMPTSHVPWPLVCTLFAGCAVEPALDSTSQAQGALPPGLIAKVRQAAAAAGVGPMPAPPPLRAELVELGRMLAFDKILSGNRDTSCMTCHHPSLATGDERSLAIGQGGAGLGAARTHPGGVFIARNAPPLYNLHVIDALFWDGRVAGHGADLTTPAGDHLTAELRGALALGPVAAQAMFPVLSREEMRGAAGQNPIANLPDDDPGAIWAKLMQRLRGIVEYRRLFEAAYPGTRFGDLSFAHAANAIAAFELAAFFLTDSPWDRFVAGDDAALTFEQLRGAELFFGKGGCGGCHGGPAFTDLRFHNTGLAQIGPGVGNGPGGRDDFGRHNVTGLDRDRYRFRTPPLRNVALTGPWGHAGQIVDLREFVAHYEDPAESLLAWDAGQLEPALRGTVVDNFDAILANLSGALGDDQVAGIEIGHLTAFMEALTDPRALDQSDVVPTAVPSGLPVD